MTQLISSISGTLTIVASAPPVATTLTIAGPANVTTGVSFTITGKLTRNDTNAGVAGQTIQLQQNGVNVSGATVVTASDGTYSLSVTEAAAATYQFDVTYAGGNV